MYAVTWHWEGLESKRGKQYIQQTIITKIRKRHQPLAIGNNHWKDVLYFHEHESVILQRALHESLSLLNIPSAVIFLLLTNLLNTLGKHYFMQIRFSEVLCENTRIRPKSTGMPGINACYQIMGRSELVLRSSLPGMQIHSSITPFPRQIYFWVSSF